MAVEEITLRPFQGHNDRTIKFGRVTTLVGPTEAGKTSVLRALGLLLLNRWDECYVPHEKEGVTLAAKVDGRRLVRKKGKKVNVYKLDGKVFKAFGKGGVPDPVAALANVGEENFQRQLEPHFWFTETAGAVSKKLNGIINLSSIDQCLGAAASEVRRAKSAVEVTKDRLGKAKKEAEALEWVGGLSADLRRVEKRAARHARIASKRDSLALLLSGANRGRRELDSVSEATLDARSVLAKAGAYRQARSRRVKLAGFVKDLEKVHRRALSDVPDIRPLYAVRKDGDLAAEARRNLEILVDDAKQLETDLWRISEDLAAAETRLTQKSLKLKKKRCPTCNRPW